VGPEHTDTSGHRGSGPGTHAVCAAHATCECSRLSLTQPGPSTGYTEQDRGVIHKTGPWVYTPQMISDRHSGYEVELNLQRKQSNVAGFDGVLGSPLQASTVNRWLCKMRLSSTRQNPKAALKCFTVIKSNYFIPKGNNCKSCLPHLLYIIPRFSMVEEVRP
jgi:hypothetical protein